MARVSWSPEASADLDEIAAYLAKTSPRYASALVTAILDLGDEIALAPLAGSEVEEYCNPNIRERIHHSYRILYKLVGDDIDILTVIHGARRLPRSL